MLRNVVDFHFRYIEHYKEESELESDEEKEIDQTNTLSLYLNL